MKQFFFGLLLATSTLLACNADKPATTDETAELLRLNTLYDSALIHHDTVVLNKLYAPGFTYTNPDGKLLDRQQQLLSIASSEMKWEYGKSEDVKVLLYNQTAIVTGILQAKGSYRGNPVTIHERYTAVWVKSNQQWQLVAEQGNIIK